ncbi:MFS transporter [Ammoniphilus sp. YIM 78166]|uniref:MFS transporter n=1 Tax=Ammoniphilus sp. YIM 78166 TaxID=1644106 RepID=UPI00106F5984|nr:MFS transporter [Ammoniphilus sp. YIM 78166]
MATHNISLLVDNQPGVLAQLSELFGRQGHNIEKIKAEYQKNRKLTKINISATIKEEQFEALLLELKALAHVQYVDASMHRRVSFWLIAFCLFITLLGTNLPAPLYTLYRQEWNLSSAQITFVYALYALIVIPTIVLVNPLSERYGIKKVLILGVSFSILGSLGFALSQGVWGLIGSRIFQGLSVGMLNGLAVVAMTRFHEKHDKIKSAFIGAISGTLGNALAPLVSGIAGVLSSHPLQFPYMVHVSLAILGLIGLILVLENRTLAKSSLHFQIPEVPRAQWKSFKLSSSTSFLSWGVMSLMLSILPTYLHLFIGQSSLITSGIMVALVLGLSTINQILLKRQPIKRLIVLGYILLILGLSGIVLTLITHSILLLVFSVVLIGLGNGPSYAGSLAYLNQVSMDESRPQVISCFFVITYLGISLPILTLGLIGQWVDLTITIQCFAFIMIIMMMISMYDWLKTKES